MYSLQQGHYQYCGMKMSEAVKKLWAFWGGGWKDDLQCTTHSYVSAALVNSGSWFQEASFLFQNAERFHDGAGDDWSPWCPFDLIDIPGIHLDLLSIPLMLSTAWTTEAAHRFQPVVLFSCRSSRAKLWVTLTGESPFRCVPPPRWLLATETREHWRYGKGEPHWHFNT